MGVLDWVTAGRLEVLTRSDSITVPREEGWTHVFDSPTTRRLYLVKCFGKYFLLCKETQTLLGMPLGVECYGISTSDIPRLGEMAPSIRQWLDEVEALMET